MLKSLASQSFDRSFALTGSARSSATPSRAARIALAAALPIALGLTASAFAQSATTASTTNSKSGQAAGQAADAAVRSTRDWNLKSQLAIQGYDPVAYFPEGGGKPAKGSKEFAVEHGGVTYRFASKANREAFLANPSRYEPAHGGWCSYAMLDSEKVSIDPEAFIVKDDRLFLFYNGLLGNTRNKWLKADHAAQTTKADAAWKKLSGESPRMVGRPTPDGAKPAMAKPETSDKAATLQPKLDEFWANATKDQPATAVARYEEGIKAIGASGVLESALRVGSRAPMFELPDHTGEKQSLASMLNQGPVVVTFYRGRWCPFCNIQLAAYRDAMADFRDAGASLVAISPQTPDNSLTTFEKNTLDFPVLSDAGNGVARQFGIVFKQPTGARMNLAPFNGDDSGELPLAATYVVGQDGTIAYAFVESNYRRRAEPAEVLEAVKALRNQAAQPSGTKPTETKPNETQPKSK